MGRSSSSAGTILRMAARMAAFLLVWAIALISLCRSVGLTLAHQRLADSVSTLSAEYEQEMAEYAALLADTERLTYDRDTQIKLLKDRFGYAEPDESPIVILRGE
jgi:hypothetical protein